MKKNYFFYCVKKLYDDIKNHADNNAQLDLNLFYKKSYC